MSDAMSYLDFLLIFLCLPIGLLIAAVVYWLRDQRPIAISAYSIPGALALISLIAFVYTTPWDNYLVSERVWYYDPQKVIGVIGYVPLEEYAFFILQVVLSGLAVILAISIFSQQRPHVRTHSGGRYRVIGSGAMMLIWIGMFIAEQSNLVTGRYLGLLLLWYLPPLALQLAFGADILWPRRTPIILTLICMTAFLSLADAIAINSGIWTINPQELTGLYFFGLLPVEEALFFLVTNALIVCGVPLCLAPETWRRLANWLPRRSLAASSAK